MLRKPSSINLIESSKDEVKLEIEYRSGKRRSWKLYVKLRSGVDLQYRCENNCPIFKSCYKKGEEKLFICSTIAFSLFSDYTPRFPFCYPIKI